MAERGVHDDRDDVVRVLGEERADGLVELLQARRGPALGRDVGAVDDDVVRTHVAHSQAASASALADRGTSAAYDRSMIRAALFDFGGVILSSPFEAFARYEQENGLPGGFIRKLNSTNSDDNAWAKLERSEVDLGQFAELFEAEARDAGYEVGVAAEDAEMLDAYDFILEPESVISVRTCLSDRPSSSSAGP